MISFSIDILGFRDAAVKYLVFSIVGLYIDCLIFMNFLQVAPLFSTTAFLIGDNRRSCLVVNYTLYAYPPFVLFYNFESYALRTTNSPMFVNYIL